MKKNSEIEIYRFIMIMGVAILHFSEDYTQNQKGFYGGYLGVDFFFILSGFFLMMHFYRNYKEQEPVGASVTYIINRLKVLYPPFFAAVLLMTLLKWVESGFGVRNLCMLLYNNRWQFLLLHSVGMPTGCILRSVWFLSPLIFLSYFIYLCLCLNKKWTVGLTPVVSVLLFAFIAQKYGFFGMHFEYIGIFVGGFIRGLPEMLLGVFLAYLIKEYFPTHKPRISKAAGIAARVICYAVIAVTEVYSRWDINDFNVLPAFALLIILAFIQPLDPPFAGVLNFLGGISYWIYLIHVVVGFVFMTYFPGYGYVMMLFIYLAAVVVLSALCKTAELKIISRRKKAIENLPV